MDVPNDYTEYLIGLIREINELMEMLDEEISHRRSSDV